MTAEPGPRPIKFWLPLAVIVLAGAALWGRAVGFGFVWDDKYFIQKLASIRSLSHVPEMFTSLAAQSSYPEGFKLFRPLRTAHYALLYWLGGKPEPQAWLFHLANIVWHIGAAFLLYLAGARIFQLWRPGTKPALVEFAAISAALGFLVHPAAAEVVCWAKSLDDEMATLFVLASVLALLVTPRTGWALLWFALAVYSKESAVPLALAVFPVCALVLKMSQRDALKKTCPFFVVAAVFVAHRHWVIGQTSQIGPISGGYLQTLVDTLPCALTYLRLASGMPPFHIDYSYLPAGREFLSGEPLIALALLVVAAAAAAKAWSRETWRVVSLGLVWFGLFMLPVSNLLPMMQYMAERFLYLPMAGLFLAAGSLVVLCPKPALALSVAAAAILAWSGLSFSRSEIWRDDLTLFVTSSQQGLDIARVDQNAIAAILDLPAMRKAFRLDPASGKLIAVAPASAPDRAILDRTLAQARAWFPNDLTILMASAIFYAQTGDGAKAIAQFRKIADHDPKDAEPWGDLGQAEFNFGKFDDALRDLQRAVMLNPKNLEAMRTESSILWQKGDYAGSLPVLEKLHQLEPGNTNHSYWIRLAKEKLGASPALR
jgi:hypothetical protein